jgi:signal transduction histidine kinase
MTRRVAGVRTPVLFAGAALVALFVLSLAGYLNLPPDPAYVTVNRRGYTPLEIAREMLPAVAFGVAGLVAWHRRPGNRVGPLMAVTAAAILLKGLQAVPVPALVSLGIWASLPPGLPFAILGTLVLTYPDGRVRSSLDRFWIGAAFFSFLTLQLAWTVFSPAVWDMCDECRALVIAGYNDYVRVTLRNVSMLVHALLAVGLVVLVARRGVHASAPARRLLIPIWLAGGVVAVMPVLSSTAQSSVTFFGDAFPVPVPSLGGFIIGRVPFVVLEVMPWLIAVSLLLVPGALVLGLLRSHIGRTAVSSLAIQLQRVKDSPTLVESLRRALGDSSLELALWSRPVQAYVTPEGVPVALPDAVSERAITALESDDGPLAAIIHDQALAEQRQLIDGVAAVAQLAIENERLHAEVKAQLEEVRASRQRIVSAADEERRRVERNLHDGAQQRLVSLSLALGMAQAKAATASPEVAATLTDAETELKQAISELRELARGIHPAILTEAGLGPALESLAEHSPVPVVVDVHLSQRLPAVVEATVYFVAAEALTNVAKHASATSATLSATLADGWLRLTVSDNGTGGAAPERGTGLRGLIDRVTSIGGRLSVDDGLPGGTRLEVEIPCSSA